METRDDVNDLIRKPKTEYYAKLICHNKDNTKELFNVMNTLLCRKQSMPLPRKPLDILMDIFSGFFISNNVAVKASIRTNDTGDAAAPNQAPL